MHARPKSVVRLIMVEFYLCAFSSACWLYYWLQDIQWCGNKKYMKIRNVLIALTISLVATQHAHAATKFEKLKIAFQNALSAKISDYPSIYEVGKSSIRCVYVGNDEPEVVHPACVGRYMDHIPAESPTGPQFPGHSAYDVEKLAPMLHNDGVYCPVVGKSGKDWMAQSFGLWFGDVETKRNANGDLVTKSTLHPANWGFTYIQNTVYRKNGRFLYFYELTSLAYQYPSHDERYAYCF